MMTGEERAEALNKLNSLRRLEFGNYPTPIEELPRLREALARECGASPRIFIKRDDYTGPGFGGNKVRKLEYVLAGAIASGVDMAITTGGVKSNHARVTAAMCARAGLGCVLVLNRAAIEYEGLEPASLHLDRLYGAEIVRVEHRDERAPMMESIAAKLRAEGRGVEIIPLGASIPLGAVGFVRAIGELKTQIEASGLRIDHLFHCSSSGGTQAGIVAGARIYGLDGIEVVGISPDDSSEAIGAEVGRIIGGIGDLLGTGSLDRRVIVDDGFVGDGYGIPSAESVAATELLARTEGIVLDPVYTAKAMAGLIDRIRERRIDPASNVLFWHTGGQLAHFYVPEHDS